MCCCDCPEVEKTCWRWSVENGSKVVAILYLIEGISLTLYTWFVFFQMVYALENFKDFRLFVLVLLTIFSTLYFIQAVSSAVLLVGLTIKEKTAFIRMFLIFNYFFIADDIMQFCLYVLVWSSDAVSNKTPDQKNPIDFIDVLTTVLAVPFSIYSHILVSSHYKQVRRAITGPVQSAPEQEEGFVNKYLRF